MMEAVPLEIAAEKTASRPISNSVANRYDVVVIGGGPAGMQAAIASARTGESSVLLVERNPYLGGVLPQCVHDGFGLHIFDESLTGPEYALYLRREIEKLPAIDVALSTSVTALVPVDSCAPNGSMCVSLVGASVGGAFDVEAASVVLATGCRERTRGRLRIPGTRPAGVITAGTAQYMMNIQNLLPGTKAVILGSGDIGLIMARRLTLEGAEVRLVLGQEATGLYRNHVQCIESFDIPIRYGWTLLSIHGRGALKGVTVAPMNDDGTADLSRREYIRCNLLLIATGLIPERDLLDDAGICTEDARSGTLNGGESDSPVILCGNVSKVHDVVDRALVEATEAGIRAANRAARLARRPEPEVPDDLRKIATLTIEELTGGTGAGDATRPSAKIAVSGGSYTTRCSQCPSVCELTIEITPGEEPVITGAGCTRGLDHAHTMLDAPEQTFTGTVRIEGWERPLLPVRTSKTVPVSSLKEVARICRRLRLVAPVVAGETVISDIAGTGADLIATDGGSSR
ncbi:MAG: FAD-dependent oxidoreductase [Actinobacteria bacterium]|nr:FAD-dependent oxidoreductase [Actinomycetota bacterium]